MDTIVRTTATVVDQHRNAGLYVCVDSQFIRCACGHKSRSTFDEVEELDFHRENTGTRLAERRHAEHVADMLA